jgi:hypothetical protein
MANLPWLCTAKIWLMPAGVKIRDNDSWANVKGAAMAMHDPGQRRLWCLFAWQARLGR